MIENVARAMWPLINSDLTFDEAKAIEDDMGFAWVCDLAKAAIAAMTVQPESVAWRYERTDGFVILVSKRCTDQHPKGDGWTEQALEDWDGGSDGPEN